MRESRPYGFVRGALSNERPYRVDGWLFLLLGIKAAEQALVADVLFGTKRTCHGPAAMSDLRPQRAQSGPWPTTDLLSLRSKTGPFILIEIHAQSLSKNVRPLSSVQLGIK